MSNSKTITGICKLCLMHKRLERSHLLPEGVYLRLRNPKGPLVHPIVVTRKIQMATSRQVRDNLLCRQCEMRFDQLGENYALRQMNNRGDFPLLERLRVSPHISFTLNEGTYSGPKIGLETERFAYFALSVVWRSAVHTWQSPAGHLIYSAQLGSYQEPIRKYLFGTGPFPPDVTVIVTAATDARSQNIAYEPTPVLGTPNTGDAFLTCGIHFLLYLGKTNPPSLREACCFSSSRQMVFSRDLGERSQHGYNVLAATARTVGVLQNDS
jgi:hypothetical protein